MIPVKLKTSLLRVLVCALLSPILSSCSDLINFETPTCESDDTADSVMEIINKKNTENSKDAEIRLLGQLIGRDLTVPVLKLSQRKTIKFDKETGFRACVANAKLANGESGDIGYTIRWEDKKSGTYYIEIKSAEVIIEQYTSAEEKAAAIATQEKAKKDAIDADLAKKAAETLQAEKEIAAKNAEPHEEIINPPPIESENTTNNNPPPPSLCKPNEFSHLNAKLSGGNNAPNAIKLLSICVKQKTEPFDTVIYRFGTENNVELEKIASESNKFYIYTQQTTPHTGENVIFFNNGAYTYCITEALGQARGIGLVVIKENKILLDLYSGLNEGVDYDGEVGIDFEKSKSPALKIIDSRDADPCAIRYRQSR